ncbi:hypothetical protein NA32_10055, partial [Streptococcus hongkongensis]
TDAGQPTQRSEHEIIAVEHVIQWPTQERITGMKGAEHAPTAARIQQTADFKEPSFRSPVTITGNSDLAALFPTITSSASRSSDSSFSVGLGGIGVHTVQTHLRPLIQMHHHVHRRDLIIHQILDLRIAEFQPRINVHAVQIIQRAFQRVRVILLQPPRAAVPHQRS